MRAKTPLEYYRQRMTAKDKRAMIREMDGSEMSDTATRLLQSLAGQLLRASAIPMLLAYIALAFLAEFSYPALTTTSNPNNLQLQAVELIVVFTASFLLAIPLIAVGIGYCTAFTAKLSSDFIMGDIPREKQARENGQLAMKGMLKLMAHVILRAFGVLLLALILTLTSAILRSVVGENLVTDTILVIFTFLSYGIGILIAPALLGRYSLAPIILALETTSAKEAMQRSVYLLKSHTSIKNGYGSILSGYLGILFLGLLIWGGIWAGYYMFGLSGILEAFAARSIWGGIIESFVMTFPGYLTLLFIVPLWSAYMTTVYIDRRVRVEALDIRVLAGDILDHEKASR